MPVSEKPSDLVIGRIDALKIARSKKRPKKRYDRTILNRENQVLLGIARPTKIQLINYRDDRGFFSLTNAIEDAINRVHQLEASLIILKEIFDLAVEKNDTKFLVYGFNRKLTLDQQILFKETLKRYKDGRK